MPADEDLEQLGIEALGIRRDLLDLKPWLDVEIIAEVAGLEIEIDDADVSIFGGFSGLKLSANFGRECGIADAPSARDKSNRNRLAIVVSRNHSLRRRSSPAENFHNLL